MPRSRSSSVFRARRLFVLSLSLLLLLLLAIQVDSFATTTTRPTAPLSFSRILLSATRSTSTSSSSSSSSLSETDNISSSSSSSSSTSPKDTTLTLFSPCKINLFLRILGKRRPDGFHNLASLFQAISFGDTLHLTLLSDNDNNRKDIFECNMPGVPVDETNLVVRALQLLRTKIGLTNDSKDQCYFRAVLEKQVPAQAGLGGGSANAATALWGANELLGRPATLSQLVEWSGELGSDITFFLSKGTAYCTGRGEIMTAVTPPLAAGTPVCLVKPKDVGLSTPAVFGALDYDALSTSNPEELLNDFVENGVEGASDVSFVNDLEPPAFTCAPVLADIKQELLQVQGFQHVLMSGSGSTIFCIGEPEDKAAFCKDFGSRDDLQVFFAEFIQRDNDDTWFQQERTIT